MVVSKIPLTLKSNSIMDTAFDKIHCADINGSNTDFVFKKFANKYFLLITQNRKICNISTVRSDRKADIHSPDETCTYTIENNFGKDTDELRAALNFLVCKSKLKDCETDLIISFGVTNIDGKTLREIVNIINSCI